MLVRFTRACLHAVGYTFVFERLNFTLCVWVLCLWVCLCTTHMQAGSQISWNQNYSPLPAMWVLGDSSSVRAASAPNHWAIYLQPHISFLPHTKNLAQPLRNIISINRTVLYHIRLLRFITLPVPMQNIKYVFQQWPVLGFSRHQLGSNNLILTLLPSGHRLKGSGPPLSLLRRKFQTLGHPYRDFWLITYELSIPITSLQG